MRYELAESLIKRNLLSHMNRVTIDFITVDYSERTIHKHESFNIIRIMKLKSGKFGFELMRVNDCEKRYVTHEEIIKIDDMTPKDYAKAYDLNESGMYCPPPVPLGRPKKSDLTFKDAMRYINQVNG